MSQRQKTESMTTSIANSQQEDVPNGSLASCLLPELLEHIFKYLAVKDKRRAALVCVAWRDASYQLSVWKGVVINWTDRVAANSATLVPSLTKRGILRVSMDSYVTLENLARDFPNVQSLQLGFDDFRIEPIETAIILSTLQNLTELDLQYRCHIRDCHVKIIAESLGRLVLLNLGKCSRLTDLSLQAISLGLKRLQQLYLNWCSMITDKGVSYLTACNPDLDTSPTARLKYLDISQCRNLTENAMSYLSIGQSGLEYLDVGATRISEAGIKHLSKLQQLTELQLSGCRQISDFDMKYISCMPRLSQLDLSCTLVGDAALDFLASSSISSLDLQLCNRLSDEGLKSLVKMVNLRKLDLTRCQITDVGLENLAQSDSNMSSLYLRSCESVTDVGLCHLIKMPRLIELSVAYCGKVTKLGLITLAEGGTRITTLDVSQCSRIDLSALELISQSLPQLRFLYNTLGKKAATSAPR